VTPERVDNNKKIAEWLGFRFDPEGDENHPAQWHHPKCQCKSNEPDDVCECVEGCYWHEDGCPPDFYVGEEANAMVFDRVRQRGQEIAFCPPFEQLMQALTLTAVDRKTATIEAALQVIALTPPKGAQ